MRVKLNGNNFFEVSSPFQSVDEVHITPHTGIDLIMETGTKLNSPVDGIISKIVDYKNENIGKGIFIKTDSGENVIMGHLSDVKVSLGDRVQEGDFVALSGNTGFSTGSHLHLGLKSAKGEVLDPEPLVSKGDGVISFKKFLENGKIDQYKGDGDSRNFWEFIQDWKEEGFWRAMYDKPFFEVWTDFSKEVAHDIGLFILGNGDIFFLCPAILVMFATFFIGRNKFTKWIIPLWFTYFVTSIFHKMML